MGKKQKPKSKLDGLKTIVEILAGIANIVFAIYTNLRANRQGGTKVPQLYRYYTPLVLLCARVFFLEMPRYIF